MNKLLINKRFMVASMFLATVALSCGMANAEMKTLSVKAKIPFAFTAGNEQFPAGSYVFVPTSTVEPTLEVQGRKEGVNKTITAETTKNNAGKPLRPHLVFDRVGDKDFLREVWIEQKGYLFGMPGNEVTMEKQGLKSESQDIRSKYIQATAVHAAETALNVKSR